LSHFSVNENGDENG